jgi:hypothetical protein
MDVIPLEGFNVPLGQSALALSAIFLIGTVASLVLGIKLKSNFLQILPAFLFVVAFALGGFGFTAVNPQSIIAWDNQEKGIQNEIKSNYGITLSEEELEELEYPDSKLTSDFEAFGSFEETTRGEDGNFVKRELTLIWADDEMILAQSENGEDFKPLELKR